MARVLIVEDQAPVRTALTLLLDLHGMATCCESTPAAALARIEHEDFDAVLQDMNFTPGATSGDDGVALFRAIHQMRPTLPVLLITAWSSLETAVQLIREGASDYLSKPWDDTKLVTSVQNLIRTGALAREHQALRGERDRARNALRSHFDLGRLVYQSEAMHEVVSLAVRIAKADVPVLLTGANGTGKEVLADVIVANSARRSKPFIKVNLGALPDSLLEAELFGAEPGAFTGADKRRIGRFEAADGGTILLDEIGTLPPAGQTRLLRVLQTGAFERLGSSATRTVDVRVIAATNRNLPSAIADGAFREDLFFRLNVITIEMPGLAARPADILPLSEHFLATTDRTVPLQLGDDARQALLAHPWPGNVRELGNAIQRASLIASSGTITAADLRLDPARKETVERRPGTPTGAERARIEAALASCDGVLKHAADALGMSRQALYRRMARLGIKLSRRVTD